jgi:beta-phosphoglucomutase-like phosphatase (HAD superfamily)
MSALHAIIFDFDGVIANSERLHLLAFQQTLDGTPLTLTTDAYYAHYLGFDDHGVFRQLAADQGSGSTRRPRRARRRQGPPLRRPRRRRRDALPRRCRLHPRAAAPVPIAVASGAQTHEIDDVLGKAGLRAHFLAVVGADQTPNSKPAPDPYLEAFARLGRITGRALLPTRTVAIEDSRWGLESARAAGLRTVAVATTYPADALTAHAELVVGGLDGLDLDTLEQLCAR